MKKHESSEGLVNAEAGLAGMKKDSKSSSSCSAGLLLAIIIAILLLLSLVISSLFWAVYSKLTNEQLRIFDATSVSDLEPLESNDVYVDSLLLRLAAQQNVTDRAIPKSLATRTDNDTETEVRVEPIEAVRDEPDASSIDNLFEYVATREHSTTETAETSHNFPATTSSYDYAELPELAERTERPKLKERTQQPELAEKTEQPELVEKSEWPKLAEKSEWPELAEKSERPEFVEKSEWPKLAEKSEWPELSEKSELEVFDDIIDDTAALKVVPWVFEVAEDETKSFEDEATSISMDWFPMTSLLNFFNGKPNAEEKPYRLRFSLKGMKIYVETDAASFSVDENSTENLSVVWTEPDSTSSKVTLENLWDWLGSYMTGSRDSSAEEKDEDDEYSYDDIDYLDYYEDSESYEDTTDENQAAGSSRWNELVDALSRLRLQLSSNDDDELFSAEETDHFISSVLHGLQNYTDIFDWGMSDVLSSIWNDPPTELENEDEDTETTDSSEFKSSDINASVEISTTISPSDVMNRNIATETGISGSTEAPVLFDADAMSDPTPDSYEYYWYPDEERLKLVLGPRPTGGPFVPKNSPESGVTLRRDGETAELGKSGITNSDEYDELSDSGEANDFVELSRSENANADLSSETGSSTLAEALEGSQIDQDDVLRMKISDELLATMSGPKYNLGKRLADEIAVKRYYLQHDEASRSVIPKVFSEPAESSDDRSRKIAKRDVIRRKSDLPPRLLKKKTPSEIFAHARRGRQIEDDIAKNFIGMRRDLLKETSDFDSKMERVASHIDRLEDRFFRRNNLDDDYVSKEMPDDEEDPRNL